MDKQVAKRKALQTKRLRVRKSVSGSADKPRLAVYRSERHIYGQLIDDEVGRTLVSASTVDKELRDTVKDFGPTECATKIGEVLAERAQAAGISVVCFDRGGRRYAGRIAALATGARSKGLQF
jgi:large subunit ribosomal protein L18